MTGRKLLFAAALIAAVAAIAALAAMEWDANRRLREQTDHSRDLLVRLTRLEVENSRLSNLVAQANTPLADEQLAELDKLRAEVRVLRGNTNDLSVMQAELHRLHAELANIRSAVGSNAPPNVPAEDIYPRDAWKFAGYDTPEHALESVTWAISEGDQASYMAALSPELQTEMQTELADGNFGDMGPLGMTDATGYRIVDRQGIGANIRTITIYMDGQQEYLILTFQKAGNSWIVTGQE